MIPDDLLRTALTYALQQIPILSDGSPLTPERVAHSYDISLQRAEAVLDELVKDNIAEKKNGGYIIAGVQS